MAYYTDLFSPETYTAFSSLSWTGKVRGSLVRLEDADGDFLGKELRAQSVAGSVYPLSEQDIKKLASSEVHWPRAVRIFSYDSLRELAGQKHLEHLSDTVLDEYAEEAE